MKNYPLATIFLLTHNGESTIKKCMASLIGQSYQNIEIIVSDNYSDDDTPEIIKLFQNNNKGKKIIYRRNEAPTQREEFDYVGCYTNYNSCIESGLINGEFVFFCHDDDIYESQFIEKEIEFIITHPQAGAVFSLGSIIDENDKKIGIRKLPKQLRRQDIYKFSDIFHEFLNNGNTFLITPTFATSKEILDKIGLFKADEFRGSSDDEMWLRISENFPIGIIKEKLIRQRIGGDGKIYNKTKTERAEFFKVMDYFLEKKNYINKTENFLLDQYALQKRVDDSLIALNFLANDDKERAKKLAMLPLPRNAIFAFFINITIKKIKGVALIFILYFSFKLGMEKSFGKFLYKVR